MGIDKTPNKKMKAYKITDLGKQNTETYTQARKAILVDMFMRETRLNFEEISKTLTSIKMIYKEAHRAVASYKNPKK